MFRTNAATAPKAATMSVRTRCACALILGLAVCGVLPATASALTAVALNNEGTTLLTFDTSNPGAPTYAPITGLGTGQSLRALDVRPADGLLYGVSDVPGPALQLYRIDPATAVATAVGGPTAPLPGAGPVSTGLDFNPVVDRLRYVNANDENARLNPNNGTLAADDFDINPSAADIIAVAYDRNFAGTTQTTLYAINRATSSLALIGGVDAVPSPNGGTVTDIGPLGITLSPGFGGGLDIAPDGTAYAILRENTSQQSGLYTINLATGAATFVHTIGANAMGQADGFAILLSFVPCPTALDIRGCWHFNEPPAGTTAIDSSTFGNHGTYLGNPTLGVPGVRATAVSLDGVDDLVRVPDSASLDVGDSFTLEGWIKRSPTTKSHTLFNKGTAGFQLTVMGSPNANKVFLRKAGVTTIVQSSAGVPVDGAYHHVVATKNGPSTAKIYIDGVEGTDPVSPAQVVQNTTAPLFFGSTATTPATHDEFAVYDRALSASEVTARFIGDGGV